VTVIDENGRIFGKVNLVDLLVVSALVGLIPLVYGAFLLFRTPDPQLQSVTPSQLVLEETRSIRILGANLRTNLRVRIGTANTEAFLVESQTAAEVKLPNNLSPGTYDVVLLDQELELSRLPDALSIEAFQQPNIDSVVPNQVLTGEPDTLQITGNNLRLDLEVRFLDSENNEITAAVLVASPTQAEVKLSENMPADTYDILLATLDGDVLYKWPEPFVVVPTPIMEHPDCTKGTPCAGGERAVQGETEYINIAGKYIEPYMQAHFERYLSLPYTEVYESPEPIREVTDVYGGAPPAVNETPRTPTGGNPGRWDPNTNPHGSVGVPQGRIYDPRDGYVRANASSFGMTADVGSSLNVRIKLPELLPGTYTLVLVKPGELRSVGEQRELLRVQGFLTVLPHPGQRTARITVQFVVRPELQLEMSQGDTDTAVLETGNSEDYDPVYQLDGSDTIRTQSFLQHLPSEATGRVLTVLEELGVASGLSSGARGDAGAQAKESWDAAVAGNRSAQMQIMNILEAERLRDYEFVVAQVQSVGTRRTMSGMATVGLPIDGPSPSSIAGQTIEVFDAVIDVPVTLTRVGWAYNNNHVRIGGTFDFQTPQYAVRGWVTDLEFVR
jgi:hypothetical protein